MAAQAAPGSTVLGCVGLLPGQLPHPPSPYRLGFFVPAYYLSPMLINPRTLSFTDAEYQRLGELAKTAKLGRSEYIVAKLGLDK